MNDRRVRHRRICSVAVLLGHPRYLKHDRWNTVNGDRRKALVCDCKSCDENRPQECSYITKISSFMFPKDPNSPKRIDRRHPWVNGRRTGQHILMSKFADRRWILAQNQRRKG